MSLIANRVAETTTSTGTGTITLAGAKAGYQSFGSAFSNGNDVYYVIVTAAGAWEIGHGTYTAAGTTLSRTLIASSTGSLLSLPSGTADVFNDIPASVIPMLDVANVWTSRQTFKGVRATAYTISDGAAFEIDPANGELQVVTLGASRTPKATNFAAGDVVMLGIDDGSANTITWTDGTLNPTWVRPGGGGAAPVLATSGFTWVLLWKVGSTIYGAEMGKP